MLNEIRNNGQAASPGGDGELLRIRNLRTYFYTSDGVVPAVDGIDLTIRRGQTVGLVGESGCGKSVTSLSIMRLVAPPGRIVEGSEIDLDGTNLAKLSEEKMYEIRGGRISMIFQEPMTSLNPVFTIGDQISEAILAHKKVTPAQARQETIDLLRQVGIPQPEQRYKAYPHEMSGGMRQRVMIAMALSCQPELIIADEPTTALDVTIQAQILELLKALKEKHNTALLLITHDLGVIAEMAEEVAVMYAGKIVEYADVVTLFKQPKHPYTQGLLHSIPMLATDRTVPLNVIRGTVPNLLRLPSGCRFAPRCPQAMAICREREPSLLTHEKTRVACWLYDPAGVASAAEASRGGN
ncbi:MAG TPA: ABC transporter ATP-binding protein [Chloroflexota bacterium]|nr:ABC transporter ATP-binding protein [Chloroflexota bacterium]